MNTKSLALPNRKRKLCRRCRQPFATATFALPVTNGQRKNTIPRPSGRQSRQPLAAATFALPVTNGQRKNTIPRPSRMALGSLYRKIAGFATVTFALLFVPAYTKPVAAPPVPKTFRHGLRNGTLRGPFVPAHAKPAAANGCRLCRPAVANESRLCRPAVANENRLCRSAGCLLGTNPSLDVVQ